MPFKEAGRKYKTCPSCDRRRRITSFNKSGQGMRRSQCRECEAAARTQDRDESGVSSSTRHNRRRRYRVLQHYSGTAKPCCECCGEDFYEFLALDHIEGGGGKHRAEIGRGTLDAWVVKHDFPEGFRVLCHNCNQAIGQYGFCPHNHPERSLTAPPPLLTEKKQVDGDTDFLAAADRLYLQEIPITAKSMAAATGVSLSSAEKRMARLRKQKRWTYPRIKPNKGKF